nr:hypothetical protein [Tanacetum cinerariifolium]
MQRKKNDVKARTTLFLSHPDEHQLRFSKYKTTRELWAVILKMFASNEATKKTKKNLLKQQYGNFKAEGSENLEQTFTRLQVIVGQLQFMDVEIEQDDLNQKFLTSLAPEWLKHTIVWRNRSDLNTMSLDDLYNHFKVYESEVQKKSEPNSHNMAFISSAKHSSRNEDGNSASVPTASTNVPTASTSDINQIDEDDMEEMDIKWNMALLSMRADKFWKKTGKKISIQGSDVVGFDKSKAPKALMAIDRVGWDWSYMVNEEEDHALVADEIIHIEFVLMANTSAESKVFDNSLCSKDCKKNNDSLNKSRLVEYKEKEVKYIEKIRTLEFYNESNKECIEALKKKLETLKQEKEGVDGKLAGLLTASKDLDNLIESQRLDKNKEGLGYTTVPPSPAQLYLSPKKDLSWTGLSECADDTVTNYSRPSPTIESTLEDDQNRNLFVFETVASPITPKPFIKFVKLKDSQSKSKTDKKETPKKPPVKYAEQYIKPNKKHNVRGNQRNWNNLKSHQLGPDFVMKKKACFNCGDFNHLAYDCRKRVRKSFTPKPVAHRPYRPLQRPVRTNINDARPNRTFFTKQAQSYANRPVYRTSVVRSPYRAPWVPTVNRNYPRVNRKFPLGSSQNKIDDKGYWDSGCSRHMTGNISYLSDYEPFDGGYVSFGQGGCKFTGKGTIKTDKLKFKNVYFVKDLKDFKLLDDANILLRTLRQHNMYSIDLNNIVPHRDLNCLVAKTSTDECMLWHRRLGHLNFKTMNELVRHNLVRGLPTKCFENDHTCTACLKGKQHKASCKSKLVNSVTKPLHTLHIDLFGPTFKGIKREFSNARTPQQNGVAERRNKTLIEAAKTMLADANAKIPVTFWAKAVNTACYVQNRVLVNKSHNKTPYELFNGRSPAIGFLKPFGCHVMILNTLDNLGKFEENGDEGYFIGYSMSSKAFRVFNKRTRRVEENLHVEFLENKDIEKGYGPNWLFDIDFLTKSINHVLVDAGTISTNLSGTKDATRQEVKKDVSSLRYIALPNWAHDALLEFSLSKPQDHYSIEVPEGSGNLNPNASTSNHLANQIETLTVETSIHTVSSPVPTAYSIDSQEPSSDARLISKRIANQEETPSLDNILSLTNRFEDILRGTTNSDESNREEADISNMKTAITATPTPTLRIHKDHPKSQIIVEPKKIFDALQDPSWVEAMQEDLLQFKIQNVTLVDCPKGVRPIGTKWVLKNKKDERGIVIRNKARLVAQGHTQEEGIDYDEVFSPVTRIEAIRIFLAYASFMGFTTIVVTSTTKAEYVAATSCYVQVLWIQNQLLDYGHHFIRDNFEKKIISVDHIHTDENVADLLTKPFDAGRFQYLVVEHAMRCFVKGILNIYIRLYALTIKPTVYVSHIRQFWSTARIETTEEGTKILAIVDGIIRTVSESSLRQYTRRARIAQSSALPTVADEPESPQRDVSQREACLTDSGFIADQDRETITNSSTLPYDSAPRVTSPAAVEGSMQQTIPKLTALCTSLQRKLSELTNKFQAQEVEINRLKARVKLLEEREGLASKIPGDDAPIKGRSMDEGEAATESVSDDTEEMATILTSMDATTVLASRVVDVPTGSGSIPSASIIAEGSVPTGSEEVPTASPVFATATVVTPVIRRKGKEVMVESETLKKQKVQEQIDAQVAKELEEQLEREDQRRTEQIARDAEVTRIHVEEELHSMIDGLDRWKVKDFRGMIFEEVEAKFNSVWKQMEDFIPMGSKEEAKKIKMKGLNLKQESAKKQKTSEEVPEEAMSLEEVTKEKVKEMMQLVPIEEVYAEALQVKHPIIDLKHLDRENLNQLWRLVNETLSNRPPTSDKEMELWVELNRMYELDKEDQLWTHTQYFIHASVNWKLYDSCRVHHVTSNDKEIFMLVEKDYPLRKGLALVMICYKLQVENFLQMANDLVLKIYKITNS